MTSEIYSGSLRVKISVNVTIRVKRNECSRDYTT